MINRLNERERLRRHGIGPKYKVCGGTFLYLVLQAISSKAKRRGINNEGIKESTCFVDLIKLGQPEVEIYGDEKTLTQETSKYKYCKIEPAAWMTFTNETYVESINNLFANDYQSLLQNTLMWADKYLDLTQHADWLAKSIVELFYWDESIDKENTYINVNMDGTAISIQELIDAKEIRVQPLLIGVWHYIINARIENLAGLDTIDAISDNRGEVGAVRGPRRGGIGRGGFLEYKVLIMDIPKKKELETMDLSTLLTTAVEEVNKSEKDLIIPKRLTGETIALSIDSFIPYLSNLRDAYSQVKTLLFRQEPRDFESIYLANDIEAPRSYQYFSYTGMDRNGRAVIKNATIEALTVRTNFIILSGIGGLGKSMMMRHLLLDTMANIEKYRLLPFFIPLKDYTAKYSSLFEFIYEIYSSYCPRRFLKSPEEMIEIMESGRCLFLLDGLDEIKSANRPTFEKQLEQLTNGYRENIFVLSSRPYTNYIAFGRFARMSLLPFTKEQSVALMNKLDMGKQENPLKQEFTGALENSLYDTHKEFAENPLLLTIMLLTYRSHANIPVKMHKFYSKAYDTLFTEHDANKLGYRREYKSELTQDRFAEYFDEFCFLSYQDGNFDPSPEECKDFFLQLEAVEEDNPKFTWKDFMDDLTDSVCMMYEEGQKYHFLHRSFQEYFCARYFYRQEESSLWDIAMFFDDMDVKETDKTFAMLYDMKPRPVEDNVFLPFLEKLFTPSNALIAKSPNGYLSCYEDFILRIYPVIQWDEGEAPDPSVIKPASYIYSFIIRTNGMQKELEGIEIPVSSGDVEIVDEYAYFDPEIQEDVDDDGFIHYSKGDCEELYSVDEITSEYTDHFDYPEVVGTTYRMKMADVFANEAENIEIIELFHQDDFPLLLEFKEVYKYYTELKNRSATRKKDLRSKLRKNKVLVNKYVGISSQHY
nr:NACHT domain-containing protein [uncultured Acetatifactor sp.]